MAVLSACTTLRNSAEIEKWTVKDFTELKDLGLDQDAAYLATYLQNMNYPDVEGVLGDTLEEREKSQRFLIHSYAEYFATRGINRSKLIKIAGTDENVPTVIDRVFNGPLRFTDFLVLTENTIIAKIGDPVPNAPMLWSGPSAYFLDVEQPLNNIPPKNPIAVRNALSAHAVTFVKGKECVFFLSPTLTKYRNAYPAEDFPKTTPENVIEQAFQPYCTKGGNIFTLNTYGAGSETLTRREILALSNPLQKTSPDFKQLPLLNHAEAIGSWDIYEINNYRAKNPLGKLDISLQSLAVELAGRKFINYSYIIDGKYRGRGRWFTPYSGLSGEQLSLWNSFEESLTTATIYGNRQIINFQGDGFSFVAERSVSKGQEPNLVNRILGNDAIFVVEQCLLDHPKIGAKNYAGLYVLGTARDARFMVLPGSEVYFKDCSENPNFQATIKTHSIGGDLSYQPIDILYSVLDLTRASVGASELMHESDGKMSGRLDITKNKYFLTVEPEWANKNRKKLDEIIALYPALLVTEGVVDEIIPTGTQ